MKIKNIFTTIFVGGFLFLSGCAPDTTPETPEVVSYNKQNLSGQGFFVGTLPNGKSVYRYEIFMGNRRAPQYLYYISDDQPISVNYIVPTAKSFRNETIVIINGVEYTPVKK